MLDMLHPRDGARLLVMEGVSWRDTDDAEGSELLGVDLSEYYGSEQIATASRVEIVQVKYSALHPLKEWTVGRLTANRSGPGTSVFAKLADSFAFALRQAGEANASRITLRLRTNQPLAPSLLADWLALRDELLAVPIDAAEAIVEERVKVKGVKGKGAKGKDAKGAKHWLASLRASTKVGLRELTHLLRQFELQDFGSGMLSAVEANLFLALDRYTSSDPNVGNLIAFVQERAIPQRSHEVQRHDVLAHLRLSDHDFFPARPQLEPAHDLFATDASEALIAQLERSPEGLTLVHGPAGIGKTSVVQLVAAHEDFETVIYDCWAGGKGVPFGETRFDISKFLVQLTNEIDALLHTNVLSSMRVSRTGLGIRFTDAVVAGVDAARARGKRLVIAIDAADDAAQAAEKFLLHESFIPWLWTFDWPAGCTVIVSSRTENLGTLRAPDSVPRFEIAPFTRDETERMLQAMGRALDPQLVDLIYEGTGGNPRVIEAVAASLPATGLEEQRAFITEHARKKAFEYYKNQAPNRLGSKGDRVLLAVLTQSTPSLTTEVLAAIAGRDPGEVREWLARLSFGMVTDAGDRLLWRNKDFRAFATSFAAGETGTAVTLLADYCRGHFETSEYARANLSRHWDAAGRYAELLDFWMSDGRLAERVGGGAAGDDVITDVQYALLASARLGRHLQTVQLLSFAADLARGRTLFLAALRADAGAAVQEQFAQQVLAMLGDESRSAETGRGYLALAAALALHEPEAAMRQEAFARAQEILKEEVEITPQDIVLAAIVTAADEGLERGLEYAAGWEGGAFASVVIPDLIRRTLDGTATAEAAVATQNPADAGSLGVATTALGRRDVAGNALDAVRAAAIGDDVRLHALLALMAKPDFVEPELQRCLNDAKTILDAGVSADVTAMGRAVESLLERGFADGARLLLPHWTPDERKALGWPWIVDFLRKRAAAEALLGETFDPATFYEFRMGGAHGAGMQDPFTAARRDARALYPGYRLRALAWAGDAGARDAVIRFLDDWSWSHDRRAQVVNATATNLLQAIQALPGHEVELVRKVFAIVRDVLEPASRDYEIAAFLAPDPNWGREAESWIRDAVPELAPPRVRASDAAAILIRLYPSARQVDRRLASDLFARARMVASDADAGLHESVVSLMRAAEAASEEGIATVKDLLDAAAVLEHAEQIESELPKDYPDKLLWFLARTDLGSAFALATAWDRRSVLRASHGVFAIAKALRTDPASMWPLVPFAPNAPDAIRLMGVSITAALDRGDRATAIEALTAYAALLATHVEIPNHVLAASKLVEFAGRHGLADEPVVQGVASFVKRGLAAGIEDAEKEKASAARTGLAHEVVAAADGNPLVALKRLHEASDEELRNVAPDELAECCAALASALSSERVLTLLPVIERASAGRRAILPLAAILRAAGSASGAAAEIRAAISSVVSEELHSLTQPRSDARNALEQAFAPEDYVALMTSPIAQKLRELSGDEIQRWIGHLVPFVGYARRESFRFLLDRALRKLAPPEPIAPQKRTGRAVLVHELTNLLGYQEVSTRWRAVYSLVHLATSIGDQFYALVRPELDDESHDSWMAKREWLLFTLEHLSMREPERLIPLLPAIVAQALRRDFPHAKIREHASSIALAIEAHAIGTLTVDESIAIRAVNRPREGMPVVSVDRPLGSFEIDKFDTILRYAPLARCFDIPASEIMKRCRAWIDARWPNRERISATGPYRTVNEGTPNEQGVHPFVEGFSTSYERHAMLAVAGALIDGSRCNEEEWTAWSAANLRMADPALPVRLLIPPPSDRGNYRTAVKLASIEELVAGTGDDQWITVAGQRDFVSHSGYRSLFVRSVVVPAAEAAKRLEALEADSETSLPRLTLRSTQFLSELEEASREAVVEEPSDGCVPWIIDWFQEFAFEEDDPFLRAPVRSYFLPGTDVTTALGLVRAPLTLTWNCDGVPAARHETWHSRDRVLSSTGNRLVMRRDVLARYLAMRDADLLFVVRSRFRLAPEHRDMDPDVVSQAVELFTRLP